VLRGAIMRSKTIIALGLIGLGLLGGCSGGRNTALTTVPTAHLAITLPTTTVTEGTPFTFTVKALDATNAVVPTYTGTVHITTSDTAAKLPADATLAQGVGTFTVTFNTTGNQTITASDTVGDASSGISPAVSVKPTPVPTIASLSPAMTATGGTGFTLIVNGSNFVLTSVVQWNGSNRSTTFVSSSQVTAQITAADIATAGAATVTVFNPAPGGGRSNSSTFTITTGAGSGPTISVLAPSCAPAGEQFINGVNNQLTVIGPYPPPPGFVAGSVVRWNGSDRPTTSNGSVNALTAQISASDIAAAGTAVVTVFNPGPGGGLSNSLTFTITTGAVDPQSIAVDPTGKFAYVMNGGCSGGAGGYVSMYTINPTTGALASIGPPVWTDDYGYYPGSVTVAPSGKFVYVTNSGDVYDPDYGSVAMYTIDATTGALTYTGSINGNCPGLCLPSSMVVDPSGKFAYVASGGGGFPYNVEMYTINGTTGALTSIGTVAAGTDPVSVAVDPSGKFAYVVNENFGSAGNVSMYAVNATTGALTSMGTIAAGTGPVSVAVDPSVKFAYVTNSGSNDVSMYTIDATTGTLTSMGTIAAGTGPISVAVDPASKFAYVANSGSNGVSMYTINATTGSLTLIGTIAARLSPSSIAIHPSGKFAYVTNSGSNDVSMYSIGATGTLTLIGTIGT
jgi:YVTN family beta-propeller protein